MVKLPGGFSPWQAAQQLADDANPFDGGSRDRDVFSDRGNQRNGVRQGYTGRVIQVNAPSKTNGAAEVTDPYGYGGGGGSGASADDLNYLNDQESLLQRQLQSARRTLGDSLTAVNDNYNKEVGSANGQRSRALENFGMQREDTQRGKDGALSQVDMGARTLANSLRQRIGLASGSSSSAYKIAAPNAVARDASMKRTGVMDSYGKNFRDLEVSEKRAVADFQSLLDDLARQRKQREQGVRSDVLTQEQEINRNLAEVARQRALAQGGGYDQVKQAMSPYSDAINSRQDQLDSMFSKYRQAYKVNPVKVQTPQLRDYTVDRSAINANEQAQTEDPYAPYSPFLKAEDDQDPLLA